MISAVAWVNTTPENHLLWQYVPFCYDNGWNIKEIEMQKGNWDIGDSSLHSEIQLCLGDLATLVWRDLVENIENAKFHSVGTAVWWISAETRTSLSTKQCITSFQVTIFHRDVIWGNEGICLLPLISAATRCSAQPSQTRGVRVHLLKRKKDLYLCLGIQKWAGNG